MGYRVKDKVAVITGAGSGVGRACMELFSEEGAKVVGCSRTQEKLDETQKIVEQAGGEAITISADLSKPEGAEQLFTCALKKYGRIDILINSAGVGYSWAEKSPNTMNDIENTTPDKWHEILQINLDSTFYTCRLAIPQMKKQGKGSIVNVTSISGYQGLPVAHTYTAAKGAAINLTRSIAVAYVMNGIRANCIAPGFIDTPMVKDALPLFNDETTADQLTPMRRPGTPLEMAYGCLYLASDESSYCNGSVLTIDGGTTARQ